MPSNRYRPILPKNGALPTASGPPPAATSDPPANSSPIGSESKTPPSARRSKRQVESQIEADAVMASELAACTNTTFASTHRFSARIKAAANKSHTRSTNQEGKVTKSAHEQEGSDNPFEDCPEDTTNIGRNSHATSPMPTRQRGLEAGSALANLSLASGAAPPRYLTRQGADWTREPPKDLLVTPEDGLSPHLKDLNHATKAYQTIKGPHSPTTRKHDEITARKRHIEGTMLARSGVATTSPGGSGHFPREERQYNPSPIRPTRTPVQPADIREAMYQSSRLKQDHGAPYDDDEQAAIMDGFSTAAARAKNADIDKIFYAKRGQPEYQEQSTMAEGAMNLLSMSKSTSIFSQGSSQPLAPPQFIERLAAAARERQQESELAHVVPLPQGQKKKLSSEDRAQLQAVAAYVKTILETAEVEDEGEGDGGE